MELLRAMVARLGQAGVAWQIGYSRSAVCHVLNGTYKGDARRLLARVRSRFADYQVNCPVLGTITLARCLEEQSKPFVASGLRVQLKKACARCEYSTVKGKSK
ncbi:hypothetical protein [Desulfovulcanus sp.]